MSKLTSFLIIFLLSITLEKKLKKKTKCMNLGDNCDLTSYCCGKWVCKDYRCAVKGTKDNQVKWAPKEINVIGSIIVLNIIIVNHIIVLFLETNLLILLLRL